MERLKRTRNLVHCGNLNFLRKVFLLQLLHHLIDDRLHRPYHLEPPLVPVRLHAGNPAQFVVELPVHGGGDAVPFTDPDHGAGQHIHFGFSSGFDVLQHRGFA